MSGQAQPELGALPADEQRPSVQRQTIEQQRQAIAKYAEDHGLLLVGEHIDHEAER
jgi:hypothetical protein